jgi:hypothetical protein
MQSVPQKFQPKHPIKYPEDNTNEFERWFFENWKPEDKRDRTYLPILWTGYFCRHKYGRDHGAKMQLQRFVNSLDKSKSYYSILQYDSGPLINLPGNVRLMAMSGPRIDYPLPLICEPHNFHINGTHRTIFANFVGAITHPCRKGIVEHLSKKPDYYISTQRKPLTDFCHLLSKSVFTLCPRGFGETSFRIQEALQAGSVPVYISDCHIIPHGREFDYGVLIHSKDVHLIDEKLKEIPAERIKLMQENGKRAYREMFTYEGCKKLILENV